MLCLPATTRRVSCSRVVLAALAGALTLTIGGCSTSGNARFQQQAWRLDGAPAEAGAASSGTVENAPEEPTTGWSAEREYEYRGGRDPKSGRAHIQM